MCTGSGCILISLLLERENAHGTGVVCQISHRKLLLWQKTGMAKDLGVEKRQNLWKVIHFQHRIFGKKECEKRAEIMHILILSNPPYIATEEIEDLMDEVCVHDREGHLTAWKTGFIFTEISLRKRRPGGWLLYEIGYTQGAAVSGMMKTAGFEQVQVRRILPGLDRVVIGRSHCKNETVAGHRVDSSVRFTSIRNRRKYMFDKLDDLLVRFEELLNELGEPGVTDDQEHFQKLMKEQSDLQPIVDAYKEYKEKQRDHRGQSFHA